MQNPIIRSWLITVLMMLSVAGAAQPPDTLTLAFCRQRAVEVYPLVKQRLLNQEISSVKNQNTDKNYLPQFTVNAKATYQSDVPTVPLEVPGVTIIPPDKSVYDFQLQLDQLIWDGGVTQEQKKLEQAELEISQQQIEVELYKVKERVNGLFYKILMYRKNREELEINRQKVADKLKEIRSGIKNGMLLQSNADVLQAQILEIDQGISQIDSDLSGIYSMMSELLLLQVNESTLLPLPDPVIDFSTYVNLRPEYLLLNLQQNKLELGKKLIATSYMPKFSGFAKLGYGKPGLNVLSTDFEPYYLVGIGLKWDIINWNQQKNRKKIIDFQKGIVDVQKEVFDKNLKIQIEEDLAQINKYKKLIEKDLEIITLREKIAKTASSQLDNGVITSTQYLDELNKTTKARLNMEIHQIGLSLAKVNYLKTIGKF